MCELLGFTSDKKTDIRKYLRTFYSHSVNHPHGWGIMREHNGQTQIIKEPVAASGSRRIGKIVCETAPQTNALAHIRLATVGAVKLENCHPYSGCDNSGRRWTMIHNGTIYSGKKLMKYLNTQKGDTDSERIFMYLMDEINRIQSGDPLTPEQRFQIIENLAVTLSPRNKLNLIIYDSEIMYVHKNMRDTLSFRELDGGIIFSTKPLDGGNWQDYPLSQVNAFHNGKLIIQGTKQTSIFTPSLEYINAMDGMHI